jgi:hypothetical protein
MGIGVKDGDCFCAVIVHQTSEMTRHVAGFPYTHEDVCHKDLMLPLLPFFLETVDSTETFEVYHFDRSRMSMCLHGMSQVWT